MSYFASCCCDKNSGQNQCREGKKRVYFIMRVIVHSVGSQGRNSKQQPGNRNSGRYHRVTQLQGLLAQFAQLLSYITYDHFPGVALPIMEWVFQYLSLIQKKCPTNIPIGQSDGDNSSHKIPSSQETPVWVKLTKTNQYPKPLNFSGYPVQEEEQVMGCMYKIRQYK